MPSLFHSSDNVTRIISLTVLAILIIFIGIFMYHDDAQPIHVVPIASSGLDFKNAEIAYINNNRC